MPALMFALLNGCILSAHHEPYVFLRGTGGDPDQSWRGNRWLLPPSESIEEILRWNAGALLALSEPQNRKGGSLHALLGSHIFGGCYCRGCPWVRRNRGRLSWDCQDTVFHFPRAPGRIFDCSREPRSRAIASFHRRVAATSSRPGRNFLRAPIRRRAVMLMSPCLPIPVGPRVIAKIGCISQLSFGDAGAVTL